MHKSPDAPCVVCGKVGHPYAKGMCNSCYQHYIHYGNTERKPLTVPSGTIRNGWMRIGLENGIYEYRCVYCGQSLKINYSKWPQGKHRCRYKFKPQNEAQRAVVDIFIRSRYGLDMTYADIAKAFGISRPYVSTLLLAARRAAEEVIPDD